MCLAGMTVARRLEVPVRLGRITMSPASC